MKIAWFTPFSPPSAIGDYSEAITRRLSDSHEVTIFCPVGGYAGEPRPCALPVRLLSPCEPPPSLSEFDLVVYNLGNHLYYHLPIYETSLTHPGVVILHDVVMRDFFFNYSLLHHDEPHRFVRHALHDHGDQARQHAEDIIAGRAQEHLDDPARLRFPMFPSALHNAAGVIVHSEYARQRVAEMGSLPVQKIDFPVFGPLLSFTAHLPTPEPDPEGKVRLLTFGCLNRNKLVHTTIEAIAQSPLLRERVRYQVIGSGASDYEQHLKTLVRDHGLESVVTLAGRQSDEELCRQLSNADVVVNLRNPHLGEGSATLNAALMAGCCTIVWDHGYYGEFPDDVVVKIASEAALTPTLETVVQEGDYRRRMAEAARRHALARFNTDRYCGQLEQFAETIRSQQPLRSLADRVGMHLKEMGCNQVDRLADSLAFEMAELWGGGDRSANGILPPSQSVSESRLRGIPRRTTREFETNSGETPMPTALALG